MAMEMNGMDTRSKMNPAEQLMEKQALRKTEKAKEAKEAEKAKEAGKAKEAAGVKAAGGSDRLHDEYIRSEKSGEKPAGLYRVGQDENGNRKVFFDNPDKPKSADGTEQPKINGEGSKEGGNGKDPKKVNGDHPDKQEEKCVGNTDKVDREIRKLKEKKQQLEQQIRAASGDEKKIRELERKLAQVEGELSRKDNDTYRKQHSTFS